MPDVFVVQALIANTGAVTATDVSITLDYDRDPASGWVLVNGEDPERGVMSLAAGTGQHVYWLARYPATTQIASHQYTVTAVADNAAAVATSDNAYGNPAPGMTVQTVRALSTGNSGIVSHVSGDIVVGVPFTISISYDLGSNPDEVMFSPVGNPDFAAGAFRLVASSVRLYNDAGTQAQVYPDQLYYPTLPAFADNGDVTYTFVVILGEETRLCSYADVGFKSNYKYDQFYCEGGWIIPVTGTLEMELDKQVSLPAVQQGETLTCTIRYTNTGTWAMTRVWIWDDLDPAIGSIITSSIAPPWYDSDELLYHRVAWYLEELPVGAAGTLTCAVRIDGAGEDLWDGLAIVNRAFQGIGGHLPLEPALAATVTTTVEAPDLSISKTDGRTQIDVGERLTYTLCITNDGSIPAAALVITDLLPAYVVPVGPASPITDSQVGGILVWSSLEPIPAPGGRLSITIPCQILPQTPHGAVLTNQMTVAYENPAGHAFRPAEAVDVTTVLAPVLEIAKDAAPDPVENGALLTFTLFYSNSGPIEATGAVITDRVPISATFVSCGGGQSCDETGGVVTWLVGTVPSQAAGLELELVVQTDPALHTGDLVMNDDYGIASDQTPYLAGAPVAVMVVRPAAVVEGRAFVDADGDGLRDEGEAGIADITVTLPAALEPTSLTDGEGYYAFRVEVTTPVSVTAGLPDGYFRTTPGLVWLEPILRMTQTVDFGYAVTESLYGVIYGIVFDDADADGHYDGGEAGLAGVTVTSLEAVTATVTTNPLGQYAVRFSTSGPVTITETNLPLYVSTTPDQMAAISVVGSSGSSPVDFGDLQGIGVSGRVFLDLNVNGMDDVEPGIAGVTVWAGEQATATGATGTYTAYLPITTTSPISLIEMNLPGFLSTNAIPGPGVTRLDLDTLLIESPAAGSLYRGDFGDVVAADVITITGAVWDDNGAGGGTAGNGAWDGAEPPLAGALIELSSGLTLTTPAGGAFSLLAPAGEPITVVEGNPPGYLSTGAVPGTGAVKIDDDTLLVGPLSGGSTSAGNLFGDVRPADLALSKQDWPDPVTAGSSLTYTVVVANLGPAEARGVVVTDSLPVSVTLVACELTQGSFNTGTGTWDAGMIDVGRGATMTLVTLLDPAAAGVLVNAAAAAADTPDTEMGNNAAETTTHVVAAADLAVSKDDWPDPVVPGGVLTYTIAYANYGLSAARAITIYDLMGPELDFGGLVAVEPPLPGFYHDGNYLSWAGPGLLPGVSGTIVYTATVRPDAAGTITNAVHIASMTPDDQMQNNDDLELTYAGVPDQATIYGWVFEDSDRDGLFGPDESGIAEVAVTLDGQISTTTDLDGLYVFLIEEGGLHVVSEKDPAGYFSTTPNTVTLTVELGHGYQVDFGDVLAAGCSCPADLYEDDDSSGQAATLSLGEMQVHDFCDDAADWAAFDAQAGAVYTLTTVSWGQRADAFLSLFDTDGETLLAANDDYQGAGDYSSQVVWQAPAGGTYYVRTTNRANLDGCLTDYDLWLQEREEYRVYVPVTLRNDGDGRAAGPVGAPEGVISHSCPDEYEPDDSWETAGTLVDGMLQVHSFDSDPALYAADKDWLGFDLRAHQAVTVTFVGITNTVTLLELYDGQGSLLAQTAAVELVWEAQAGGRYFVAVSPLTMTFGCADSVGYRLIGSREPLYELFLPVLLR